METSADFANCDERLTVWVDNKLIFGDGDGKVGVTNDCGAGGAGVIPYVAGLGAGAGPVIERRPHRIAAAPSRIRQIQKVNKLYFLK